MFSWFKGEEKPKPNPSEFHKPEFYHGADGPDFKVLSSSDDDYEVRLYEKSQWVSTNADPNEVMSAFWKLYSYIGGKNDQSKKMPMNMPVRCHVVLNDDDVDGSSVKTFTMSFYLSSSLLPDLPKPSDEHVFIEENPRMVVYVSNFSGFAKEKDWKESRKKLREALGRDSKGCVTHEYYSAGYDPPYKLWGRRNEMMLLAEPQPDHAEDGNDETEVADADHEQESQETQLAEN